jgi:hypothetical protein
MSSQQPLKDKRQKINTFVLSQQPAIEKENNILSIVHAFTAARKTMAMLLMISSTMYKNVIVLFRMSVSSS